MTRAVWTNPGDRDERRGATARRARFMWLIRPLGRDSSSGQIKSGDQADRPQVLPRLRVTGRLLRLFHEYGVRVAPHAFISQTPAGWTSPRGGSSLPPIAAVLIQARRPIMDHAGARSRDSGYWAL